MVKEEQTNQKIEKSLIEKKKTCVYIFMISIIKLYLKQKLWGKIIFLYHPLISYVFKQTFKFKNTHK